MNDIVAVRTAAALAIVLLASGCAATGSENDMTPQDSQAELLALLDETQVALGSSWDNDDDPSPLQCTLANGDTGVTFSGYRRSSEPVEVEAGIQTIVGFWESKGFEVEVKRELAGLEDVFVHFPGDKDRYLHFSIGENIMAVEGWGACVPGSVLDEIDRIEEELKN